MVTRRRLRSFLNALAVSNNPALSDRAILGQRLYGRAAALIAKRDLDQDYRAMTRALDAVHKAAARGLAATV